MAIDREGASKFATGFVTGFATLLVDDNPMNYISIFRLPRPRKRLAIP